MVKQMATPSRGQLLAVVRYRTYVGVAVRDRRRVFITLDEQGQKQTTWGFAVPTSGRSFPRE
jgi:hypothetical protein